LDLDEFQAKQVLEKYGIPICSSNSVSVSVKSHLRFGWEVDRVSRSYVLKITRIAEKSAMTVSDPTIKTVVDSQLGLSSFQSLSIVRDLGYSDSWISGLSRIIVSFAQACFECDVEFAEIDLFLADRDGFVVADARLVVDDNALFRHPEFQYDNQVCSPLEALARKFNLGYVKLDGDIGVVGNGAGLVLATIDLLHSLGGHPANFLDMGGGANPQTIKAALQIVFDDPDINAILVNVLGGITHCDEVANLILEAAIEAKSKKPLVVRLVGTNEVEGRRILRAGGVEVLGGMEEAAKRVIELLAGVQK